MKIVVGVILVLLAVPVPAFAKSVVLLSGVVPIEKRPDIERLASTLDDLILAELSGRKAIRLVDRGLLEAVLQERKLSLLDLTDSGKAIQIGKLVNANRVVSISLGSWGGDRLGFGFVAVDPVSGEIVGAHSIGFSGTPATAARKLALEIETTLAVRPPGAKPDRLTVIAMFHPVNLTVGGGYEFARMALYTQLIRQLLSSGGVILVARESVGDLIAENVLSRFERGRPLEGRAGSRLSLWSLKSTYEVGASARGGFATDLRVSMDLAGSFTGGHAVEWEEGGPAGQLVELTGRVAKRILQEVNVSAPGSVPDRPHDEYEGAPGVKGPDESYARRIRESQRIFQEGLERCGDEIFNGKGGDEQVPASVIQEGAQMHLRATYIDPYNLAAWAAAVHCLNRLSDPDSKAKARKLQDQFQTYAHLRIGHEFLPGQPYYWIPPVAIQASDVQGTIPRVQKSAWAKGVGYFVNLRRLEPDIVVAQTRTGVEFYDTLGDRTGGYKIPKGEAIKYLSPGGDAIHVVLFDSAVEQPTGDLSQSGLKEFLSREIGVHMVRLKSDGRQEWSIVLKDTISRWAGLEPKMREIYEQQYKAMSSLTLYPCSVAAWHGQGVLTGSGAGLTLYSDTGQVRWRIEARESGGACGPIVFVGSDFGVVATSGTSLLAFDSQGKMLWRRQLQHGPGAALIQLAAGSDLVFVGTQDGSLFSIDRSGYWRVLLKTYGCICMGMGVLKGDAVLAASSSGIVYAVGLGGRLIWNVPLGSAPESIAVSPSGDLFAVGAGDGNIYVGNVGGELIGMFARKEAEGVTFQTEPGYVFATPKVLVVGGLGAKTLTAAHLEDW